MENTAEVLQYTGYSAERGGIVALIRTLRNEKTFGVVHGVAPDFVEDREPALPLWRGPRIAGEKIGPGNIWRARAVAVAVRCWLREDSGRVFHGHSRAGLLVGLWLHWLGERRMVVTVHCYGRQRWFYRWAARRLGRRLFWLSPAMKKYYGVGDDSWAQCIPGCVAADRTADPRRPAPAGMVRLGGIGALVRWKNWHLVIAALALLPAETRRRLRFRHIGGTDGSPEASAYAGELRARTAAAGLGGIVEWLGEQTSSAPFLSEVDCLVVASRNEPFSIAMLEALHAGVPVLAADSGGAADVVAPGRNGWLFRSDDAHDLARHLAMLVEGGALARVAVKPEDFHRFNASVVADTLAELYRGLETK